MHPILGFIGLCWLFGKFIKLIGSDDMPYDTTGDVECTTCYDSGIVRYGSIGYMPCPDCDPEGYEAFEPY